MLKKALRESKLTPCIVFNLQNQLIWTKDSNQVYIIYQMSVQKIPITSDIILKQTNLSESNDLTLSKKQDFEPSKNKTTVDNSEEVFINET